VHSELSAQRAQCTASSVHSELSAQRAQCTASSVHSELSAQRAQCTARSTPNGRELMVIRKPSVQKVALSDLGRIDRRKRSKKPTRHSNTMDPRSTPSPEPTPIRKDPVVMELSSIPCCPVCSGKLVEIRAKYHCSRCHRICETCCEGGRG